ncbi:MAG: J domain-containing protein [Bacteroidales bacterium]
MKNEPIRLIPDKYYTLLGLSPGAEVAEVRKAYRAKVKLCHPDIAPAADGTRLFIELTEAYEFLLAALQDKNEARIEEENAEPFVVFEPSMQELVREEMEKLRRMAKEEARRKYREYQQSKEYQINKFLGRAFDMLFQLLGVVVILSALTGLYHQYRLPDFSYLSAVPAFLVIIVGLIMILFPLKRILAGKRKKIHP